MSDPAGPGLRRDIQALRAIAVAAVLVYHLWPDTLPGGFVGVDVFFVISGFLITGSLLREAEATGKIRILSFWGRRARRLLPAALTVLLASAIGVALFVPENLWIQFSQESLAATLYVQNWVLAGHAIDYFAASNMASPAQHFWSLSAEEQFYFAIPLLLVGTLLVAQRLGSRRRLLFACIATTTFVSFVYSVWLTEVSAPTAYFVTTARAWEFGVGALLVFVPRPGSAGPARLAMAAGLLGILTSTVLISNRVPFPGVIAVWPVFATAAIIWGGAAMGRRSEAVAGMAPAQFLGRVSYSLYLWHWPLIVILAYALNRTLTDIDKVAIALVAVLLASLTTRFIEDPIRYPHRSLGGGRSLRPHLALAAAGMASIVAVSGIVSVVVERNRAASALLTATMEATAPDCLGAMARVNAASCHGTVPSRVLVPDPVQAGRDSWSQADCWAGADELNLHVCTFGPPDAPIRLAAIGDSHSNAFLAAYKAIAEQNGWRIDVAGHNGCYWTTGVQSKATQAMVDGCQQWKAHLNAYLDGVAPYRAILVTNSRNGAGLMVGNGSDVVSATAQGLSAAWTTQVARGTRILAIRDNPAMSPDVVTCVVRNQELAETRCARARDQALGERDALVEAVGQSADARLLDMTDIYCSSTVCVPVIGNVVVYQDGDHLTATFVRSMVPILSSRIAVALQ